VVCDDNPFAVAKKLLLVQQHKQEDCEHQQAACSGTIHHFCSLKNICCSTPTTTQVSII
jgi:hypothetical protein